MSCRDLHEKLILTMSFHGVKSSKRLGEYPYGTYFSDSDIECSTSSR